MLREMGIEANRIADDIAGLPKPGLVDRAKALVGR